jgi:proteasome lid subunit RPN8/RPN11
MASTVRALAPLVLPAALRRQLLAHAKRAWPEECCGLLVGSGTACYATMPVRNVARGRRRRFEVDPRAHIALRRTLRSGPAGLAILGVYHSHPRSAPVPSPTDVAELQYPAWVYLLVGQVGNRRRVRAYRMSRGQFVEVRILAPERPRA